MKTSKVDILFNTGRKTYTDFFTVIYLPTNEVGEVCISAPIKKFPKAVDRNRVKRLIKAVLVNYDFSKFDIFLIYRPTDIKSYVEINNDIKTIELK